MISMKHFQLLYAVVSTLWLAYFVHLFLTNPQIGQSPHFIRNFVLCGLIIVAVPVALGWLLLFRLAPWITRRLHPAR